MRRSCTTVLASVGVLIASLAVARAAAAICTAAQIIAQEPATCPNNANPCSITKTYVIDNNCVLDFGTRAVTLNPPNGALDINSGSVTLKAGSLTIAANGVSTRQIDGRGNGTPPATTTGGHISIQTTGAVNIQKSGNARGRIDVSGDNRAGSIAILAGGAVTIAGALNADNSGVSDALTGGTITILSGGDITSPAGSIISGIGSGTAPGGNVAFGTFGNIDLGDLIDVHGSDAGNVVLSAGGHVNVQQIDAHGAGDGAFGGNITITAGTAAQILGNQLLQGSESTTQSGGGDGGTFSAEADYGDLLIAANITALGASPDGGGGEIDLTAHGAMTLQSGTLNVRNDGPVGVAQGSGGLVDMQADLSFSSSATIDASGGVAGGEVDIDAGSFITLNGKSTRAVAPLAALAAP